MKIILLILLCSFSAFSQIHTVQIELVSTSTVYPLASQFSNCGSQSSDASLNSIFAAHNVYRYCSSTLTSYPSLSTVNGGLIDCQNCNVTDLIDDLQAYNSVISRARLTPGDGLFANVVHVRIPNPPTQTGVSSSQVVITSSDAVNSIFTNHTVFEYEHDAADWYTLKCDCYSPDLIQNLLSANFISENTFVDGTTDYDNYSYEHIGYFLGTTKNDLETVRIYPNPFYENLKIDTKITEASFEIYDITGKNIGFAKSTLEAELMANSLKSGLYFLRIDAGGASKTVKIVKL